MKKLFYETPSCEAHDWVFENTLLTGSDFGTPGQPGSNLDELPGLNGISSPVFPGLF